MYFPSAARLPAQDAKQFYVTVAKPLLPDDKAMRNDDTDTALRRKFSTTDVDLVTSNVQDAILRSL